MPRKKKTSLPTSTTVKTPTIKEEPAVFPGIFAEEKAEVVAPIVLKEDEVKTLKQTLRQIVKEKPVLPYPEEVRLQTWLQKLEAALK